LPKASAEIWRRWGMREETWQAHGISKIELLTEFEF